MSTNLTTLEVELVKLILDENASKFNKLRDQLPFLKVKSREYTGVGLYVYFQLENYNENIIDLNLTDVALSAPKLLTVDTCKNEISFELNITNGYIHFLELIVNGEEKDWNGTYTKYTFIDNNY